MIGVPDYRSPRFDNPYFFGSVEKLRCICSVTAPRTSSALWASFELNVKAQYYAFVIRSRQSACCAYETPKLYSQAAVLAAHLRQKILGALTFAAPQSFTWTDSSTVLQWLASACFCCEPRNKLWKPHRLTNAFTSPLPITLQTLERADSGTLQQIFQVVSG